MEMHCSSDRNARRMNCLLHHGGETSPEDDDARGKHALTSWIGLKHDLGVDESRREENTREQAGLQLHLARDSPSLKIHLRAMSTISTRGHL